MLGSLTFGVGWGLAGFCPGPALVALGAGYGQGALVFVVAMLAGMLVIRGRARARTATGRRAPELQRAAAERSGDGCRAPISA